ncbi:hypothetical protein ACOME3_003379 [Neoechinorhynchus agilis]
MSHPDIVKSCYEVSRITSDRSKDEVDKYLREKNINLINNVSNISPLLTFSECQFLPESIIHLFSSSNFTNPSPIQSITWPVLLSGSNYVGIAITGSGKTLAFMIPLLVHVSHQPPLMPDDGPIGLVLVPTRELALQITEIARPYCDAMNMKIVVLIGGESKMEQARKIGEGAHIYVATPGRLIDLLDEHFTTLFRVSMVVLDEADKILDMGFERQTRRVLSCVRQDRWNKWLSFVNERLFQFRKDFILFSK